MQRHHQCAVAALALLRQIDKAGVGESLGVELDNTDIGKIDNIDETDRRVDPGFAPW